MILAPHGKPFSHFSREPMRHVTPEPSADGRISQRFTNAKVSPYGTSRTQKEGSERGLGVCGCWRNRKRNKRTQNGLKLTLRNGRGLINYPCNSCIFCTRQHS